MERETQIIIKRNNYLIFHFFFLLNVKFIVNFYFLKRKERKKDFWESSIKSYKIGIDIDS